MFNTRSAVAAAAFRQRVCFFAPSVTVCGVVCVRLMTFVTHAVWTEEMWRLNRHIHVGGSSLRSFIVLRASLTSNTVTKVSRDGFVFIVDYDILPLSFILAAPCDFAIKSRTYRFSGLVVAYKPGFELQPS